ncbi:tRNA (adenosine(37)-N6)-threonylcarbamoyltransferase complex ATPase subunit type 1 TsaE [Flavobacteriales bacterium]|nr:tRNA (adenosine(37)-N6)-threonylcarbamoyltransferase complex ATPase subunit type 1 TsaE [Flavobacteriales bacterium]
MNPDSLNCLWRSEPFGLSDLSARIEGLMEHLKWGDVVALQAPMGTGKTTVVSAVAKHHNAQDVASSPTFALCQSYPVAPDKIIRHLDLYRIRHVDELLDLGWDELMEDGDALTFVEWPEKAADEFPESAVLLRIERLPDGKRMATLWQRESA